MNDTVTIVLDWCGGEGRGCVDRGERTGSAGGYRGGGGYHGCLVYCCYWHNLIMPSQPPAFTTNAVVPSSSKATRCGDPTNASCDRIVSLARSTIVNFPSGDVM